MRLFYLKTQQKNKTYYFLRLPGKGVVLQVGFLLRQHQHHLEICQKLKFMGPNPDPPNQKFQRGGGDGWARVFSFICPPGSSAAHQNLRTTGLNGVITALIRLATSPQRRKGKPSRKGKQAEKEAPSKPFSSGRGRSLYCIDDIRNSLSSSVILQQYKLMRNSH